jgi:hypothetical protein
MASDSDLPDVLSVAARIPCVDTRYCVQFLIHGQLSAKKDSDAVLAVLTDMHSDIKIIKDRDADVSGSARLFPLPPAMISALSRGSSGSSGVSSGSGASAVQSPSISSQSSGRRKRQRGDGLTWLRCPFCEAEHWNEKSHIQHVSRSLLR